MPDTDTERQRPSPDALLRAAQTAGQGRLKIFLGAAPGVGKTYKMLLAAQTARKEGTDIVVGVVETHKRAETEALLEGLETIPRRRIDYKDHVLDEMDIDAILARKPSLVLVDELAHTNVTGSRHPKRYLDVEELLAAGIDVYTTINIQHVESLNDVVAQITHVRVRETVPDGILDRADDIEVVDLSPDDLIERLREGKVYVPAEAERALRNYFQPGNLTALRELALRRTAQRVDEQMLTYMRAHAISGPWPAGERVLVCVSEDSGAAGLVRYARRLADRSHAPWTAIYVETARYQRLAEAARDRIAEALRLAERLGGQTMTIPGRGIAEDVVAFAKDNNITQIVIGKSERSRWFEMLHGSVVHDLVRTAGNISVHVIAGEAGDSEPAVSGMATEPRRKLELAPYLASTGIVAVALGIGLALQQFLAIGNISIVFLTAVLVSAARYGLAPSLFASFLSVLAYNFFFLPPLYTLTITEPENILALIAFLVAAVIASQLAASTRAQAVTARSRARTTEELLAFSRKLSGVATLDDLLWATTYQIASMLKLHAVVLMPEGTSLAVKAAYPPEDHLDGADLAAAKWSWANNHPAGRGSDTLPGARRLFLPLRTGRGAVGVLGLDRELPGLMLSPDARRLLDALMDLAALAIERIHLQSDLDRTKLQAESERLRSALLTSISHDLGTPLASIIGAASSLKSVGERYGGEDRAALLSTILDEAERLNRFVGNLLDMTKLESGAIAPKQEMIDLGEIVGTALQRAGKVLAHHRVKVDLAGDLPMLRLDFVLFEQVLFNLLDNAAKYAPPESTVEIRARRRNDRVEVHVLDEGSGIPQDQIERIFDKFHRVAEGDRKRPGTGLGLAICRGFVAAMGGTIRARNRADRSGGDFVIELPISPSRAAAA
ncbi:MAG TPA: sensor histidine kinase KdpD [Stellaceae bacterium]|jgi:two-component system sensor histidine kinase KdpD|nr:sensor histidine kinase KdpD [Stellaceae bacterium]